MYSDKFNFTTPTTKPGVRHCSIKNKVSLGIACCRFNNGRPEILLVCKRTTYAYNSFVTGNYNSANNMEIISLLNSMTVDEKLDLLSLNFNQIWYRVWLNMTKNHTYNMAKNKFESTFLADSGRRLQKLVAKSTNSMRIWEIPKGRKKTKNEPNIHCAMREFHEETGISKKSYRIFPRAKRIYSYIDDNVRYTNIYYFAFTKYSILPTVNFNNRDQFSEICDIRWMNMDDIAYIDTFGRLKKFIRPIFNYMKKYAK